MRCWQASHSSTYVIWCEFRYDINVSLDLFILCACVLLFFLSVISKIYQSIFLSVSLVKKLWWHLLSECEGYVIPHLVERHFDNSFPVSCQKPPRANPPTSPSLSPTSINFLFSHLTFILLFSSSFFSFLCFFFPLHVFAFHLFFAPNSSPLHTKEGSGSSMFFIQSREVMPHHAWKAKITNVCQFLLPI